MITVKNQIRHNHGRGSRYEEPNHLNPFDIVSTLHR